VTSGARVLILSTLAGCVFACDQLHKAIDSSTILNTQGPYSIGISNTSSVLIGLAVITLLLVALFFRRDQEAKLLTIGMGLLLGGALSNLIDRVLRGGVLETFTMGSTAYNGADLAIYAGAALLILHIFLVARQSKTKAG